MSLGSNIKSIREVKGYTKEYVAGRLKVFLDYYDKVEKGFVLPSDILLSNISELFNLSINEIINFNSNAEKIKSVKLDLKNLDFATKIDADIKAPVFTKKVAKKLELLHKKDIPSVNLTQVITDTKEKVESEDVFKGLIIDDKKTISPKLINFIEPYKYNDELKITFYTEINTNFKKGDRVFIIGGYFDSNSLINENKYRRQRDGYIVLDVDKCKITLDIDYPKSLLNKVYREDSLNITNLFIANDINDVNYIERQFTTVGGIFNKRNTIDLIYYNDIIKLNGIEIDPDVFNTLTIKIVNGSFIYKYNGTFIQFREGFIYKYISGKWVIDIDSCEAYISKSNFRNGTFKGTWNSGLYGSHQDRILWDENKTRSSWKLGSLLNTKWKSGTMESKFTLMESYRAEYKDIVSQRTSPPNNNDKGFNLIYDSEMISSTVKNGNFYNSKLVGSAVVNSVESHIKNESISYSINMHSGTITDSKVINSLILNTDVIRSTSTNTKFDNIKAINSTFYKSVVINSKYVSNDNIKILGYDEISYKPPHQAIYKIFKFYISKDSYKKLKMNDIIYIKGLRVDDGSKNILNIFDRKFKLNIKPENIDQLITNFQKKSYDIYAYLSSHNDNYGIYNSLDYSNLEYTFGNNLSEYYSIDIFIPTGDDKNSIGKEISENGININNIKLDGNEKDVLSQNNSPLFFTKRQNIESNIIDISNAYIINNSFESGIVESSDWLSGFNINDNNNIVGIGINNGDSTISLTMASNIGTIEKDDIIFLNNLYYNDIKLTEAYIVVGIESNNKLKIRPLISNGVLSQSGDLEVRDGLNRYNYIHPVKITKSKINSGFMRRAYLDRTLIENDDYNISDRTFRDIPKLKELLFSDIVFKDNENIITAGLFINSSFSTGNTQFLNGIVHNSIWNGMRFENGIFKESTWNDGIFDNGSFYENKLYNESNTTSNGTMVNTYYQKNNPTVYSWIKGKFNDGEFYKSKWLSGTFSGGLFIDSEFYNGIIEGGTIGHSHVPTENTLIYGGTVSYTVVNNGKFYPHPVSHYTLDIMWMDGIFNDGIFGSPLNDSGTTSIVKSVWMDGKFNNGKFIDGAIWENGIFTNGEFISTYGSDTLGRERNSTEIYSWNGGEFKGGYFGNGTTQSNSNWRDGEFKGGVFRGKVWDNGTFSNGNFEGSGITASGNFYQLEDLVMSYTQSNVYLFNESYSFDNNNWYGLWRDGVVSNDTIKKEKYKFDEDIKIDNVSFNNALWLDGVFSHKNGKINNSVWLSGKFKDGNFNNSSFNPFVRRSSTVSSTGSSFITDDSSHWFNGRLNNSDFFASKWEKGLFDNGSAYGMIWLDGVCNYMNAYNILWEDGVWKNGNWFGSDFIYSGVVTDIFVKAILMNIRDYTQSDYYHIWNVFNDVDKFNGQSGSLIAKAISGTEIIKADGNIGYTATKGAVRTSYDEGMG